MADGGEAPSSAKTPADFLKSIKGKPVVVKLNSGVDYRGGQARRSRSQHRTPAACRLTAFAPFLQASWPAWMAT